MKGFKRGALVLLALILAYWVVGALMVPALPSPVKEATKQFDPKKCYGDEEGPTGCSWWKPRPKPLISALS